MKEAINRLREMQQEYQESANAIRAQWDVCSVEHKAEHDRMMRHAANIEYMSNCLGVAAFCLEGDR